MYAYCRKKKKASGLGLTIVNKSNQTLPVLATGIGGYVASAKMGSNNPNKAVIIYTDGGKFNVAVATLSSGSVFVGTPTAFGTGVGGCAIAMLTNNVGLNYGILFHSGSVTPILVNSTSVLVYASKAVDARFGLTTGAIADGSQAVHVPNVGSWDYIITYAVNGGSTNNYQFVVKCHANDPSISGSTKTGSLSFYDSGFIWSGATGFKLLDSTYGIYVWNTTFARGCVIDVSGTNPTKGTIITIDSAAGIRGFQLGSVSRLNSNTAFVPAMVSGSLRWYKLTTSGTTLYTSAVGGVILAGNSPRTYTTELSDGRVYLQYTDNLQHSHTGVGFSLNSDGSITKGNSVELANYGIAVPYISALAVSTSDVLYFSSKNAVAGYNNIGYATCS